MADTRYPGSSGFGSDPNAQELNRLQRRINELEELIHQKQGFMENTKVQLQQAYDDNAKKFAADLKSSYSKYVNDITSTYNQNMAALNSSYTKRVNEFKRRYDELRRETLQLENDLRSSYKDLERKLKTISSKNRSMDESQRNEALSAIKELESDIKDTRSTLPVECFFPRKISIYSRELDHSVDLYSQKLYSIAGCSARSASLGVARLRNDTERELNKLMDLVGTYRTLLEAAEGYAASDTVHSFMTEKNEIIHMEDHELGFWSDGTFDILLSEMESHRRNIEEFSGKDAFRHLEQHTELEISQSISEQIESVKHLPELIRLTAEYAFHAFLTNDRVSDQLNSAVIRMRDQNFILEETLYGPCRAPQTKSFWRFFPENLSKLKCTELTELPDIREERRLIFVRNYSGSSRKDEFIVSVMPVRKSTDITPKTACELNSCNNDNATSEVLTRIFTPMGAVYGPIPAPDPQKVFSRAEAETLAAQRSFG